MQVRQLNPEDVQAFQTLRLRSLQEHPEAFGSSYEDESKLPLEKMAEWLQPSPDRRMFAAWMDGSLAGIISFARSPGRKTRHRAGLGAMYVAPEFRGCGIGAALLDETIRHARTLPDLEELILAVTVGNETARSLYTRTGFEFSHVEKRYIKVDDQYFDIEWMTMRL